MFIVYKILISHAITLVVLVLGMILTLLSLGVFEANVIQFGMDQLLEATSKQLSAFIHNWSSQIGQLIICTWIYTLLKLRCHSDTHGCWYTRLRMTPIRVSVVAMETFDLYL